MPRVAQAINTFDAGEWSEELWGRTDLEKYPNSQRVTSNFIPLSKGPATRRPGTRFVSATRNNAVARLFPFSVSTEQAYIGEATDQCFRFFRNQGRLDVTPGNPVELTTPYLEADLPALKWAQQKDLLYLTQGRLSPRKLSRLSSTRFALAAVEFKDGPYLDMNLGNVTIAPSGSAVDASITLTAAPNGKAITNAVNNGAGLIRLTITGHGWKSEDRIDVSGVTGTTEANGESAVTVIDANTVDLQNSVFANAYVSGGTAHSAVFKSTDVGRLVRIRHSSTWGYARITAFTNVYTVSAVVKAAFGATTAVTTWRLGAWSDTTGWPRCLTFFQERLWFGGTTFQPQTFWASMAGDYESMAPSDSAGLITADSALTWTIADEEVNAIRWMSAGKVLNIGTTGGEFTVQASSLNEGITPTNITVNREGTIGSADINALRLGRAAVHVQYAKQQLYSTAYDFSKDAWISDELTLLWDHLPASGIVDRAFQKQPWSIIWLAMQDGSLVGFTYREQPLKMAAHRHPIGGTNVKVLSVACIPGTTQDELWLVVERTINGQTKRYVEFMEYRYRPVDKNDKANWFFVDSGLTYDGAPETAMVGLDHLESETVQILADGAAHDDKVVTGGQVTLDRAASKVHIGLGYISRLVTQDLEGGSAEGSAIGKKKRIDVVRVRFKDTLGGKIGVPAELEGGGTFEEVQTRKGSDPMDQSPPLKSGIHKFQFPKGYSDEAVIEIRQDQPLPMTVSVMVPRYTTMDG